jgi:electron transfer flavoprotein beta subunit
MKIIVPIKQILDPQGISVRRDKERVFINREDYIVDPASKAAVEAALRLKDSAQAESSSPTQFTVIALSMGAPRADDALREALAMGCDAAYLVTGEALEQADTAVAARVLAAAVEKLGGADLIVAGHQSADTGAGQVGPRLAAALDYAQITDVQALAVREGRLQATRLWAAGFASVEAPLPAVVTVDPQAFQPRYAHGARIMNAYRESEVTVWQAADLALDEHALNPLLTFRRESFPPPFEVGDKFKGAAADVAQDVVLALKQQKLIG